MSSKLCSNYVAYASELLQSSEDMFSAEILYYTMSNE